MSTEEVLPALKRKVESRGKEVPMTGTMVDFSKIENYPKIAGNQRWTERLGFTYDPISTDVYLSEEQFELEREKIFKKCWLMIGRADSIPNPGDFFTIDLPILRTNVLVVRNSEGEIRAFHNICMHRANKLCSHKKGNRKFFLCEFHGWIFDTSGRLREVTDEHNFYQLDKARLNLPRIHCDTWEGFIFINVDRDPKENLFEYLGEIPALLKGYPFERYSAIFGYESELNCNWKISVDSQQEAYHAAYLHRRSLGHALGGIDNPNLHLLHYAIHGRHRSLSMPAAPKATDVDRGPVDEKAAKYGISIRSYILPENPADLPKGINPTRAPNWAADIYLIYPNFWIAPFNGQYQTHSWWPISVNRMYQRITMYSEQPKTFAERWALEYSRCMSRDVWLEDFKTLEETQRMMEAGQEYGVKTDMILQDEEVLIRHFHEVILRDIRG